MTAGLPDSSTLANYGGPLENLEGLGVVDPTTERDAAAANQAYADAAAMTHTAIRAWCKFTGAAANPITVGGHDAVWGNDPSVKPTVSHTGTGIYTVTWPVSVNDELGVAHNVNLRAGLPGNLRTGAAFGLVQCLVTAPNQLTVHVGISSTGAHDDAVGVVIDVFAI